jgi:hypothetical protein
MKSDNNKRSNAQNMEMEFLVERGRQLHAEAVFEIFAGMFNRKKSGKAKTESTGIVNGMQAGAA